jgi:hypothetical protein
VAKGGINKADSEMIHATYQRRTRGRPTLLWKFAG